MTIPEDIQETARLALRSTNHDAVASVAYAILAERKRCAALAIAEGDAAKLNGVPQAAIGAYWVAKAIMGGEG